MRESANSEQYEQCERRNLSHCHRVAESGAAADSNTVRHRGNRNHKRKERRSLPSIQFPGQEFCKVTHEQSSTTRRSDHINEQVKPANLHAQESAEGSANIKIRSTGFGKLGGHLCEARHED